MMHPVLTFFDFSHAFLLFFVQRRTDSSEVPHWSLRSSETNKGQSSLYPLGDGIRGKGVPEAVRFQRTQTGNSRKLFETSKRVYPKLQLKASGCPQ